MLEDSAVFRRARAIDRLEVDRAAVLVDRSEQAYFRVNAVGARIWALLEEPRRVSELVRILTSEFAIDDAACREATETFLSQLLERQLVVRDA